MEYQADPLKCASGLDEICLKGIPVLCGLEKLLRESTQQESSAESEQCSLLMYQVSHALFRNRLLGQTALKRRLLHRKDFVDSRDRNSVELINPAEKAEFDKWQSIPRGNELLDTLQEQFVRDAATRTYTGPAQAAPIQTYVGRNPIDYVLIEGLGRRKNGLTLDESWSAVCKSFIAGMDRAEDMKIAAKHEGKYRHFCESLLKSFSKRGQVSFDKWLKTVREQGFVRLYPGFDKLNSTVKSEARKLTLLFYRLQLWAAHCQMARAYGALALCMWVDFQNDPQINPTQVEKSLFSMMHRPQFFLGCLPFAFYSRVQLPWILKPLLDLWDSENFEPERYDVLTSLLATYADAATRRREVDRDTKAQKRRKPMVSKISNTESRCVDGGADGTLRRNTEIEVDDPNSFPELESDICESCGHKINLLESDTRAVEYFLIEVMCPRCDTPPKWFRMNPKHFNQRG
ncbi:MAG: hypothetical protein WCL32_06455 [Planctomycetota bacterium]